MYIVLYAFEVKNNCEDKFIAGWKGLTRLIYKFEGSLGSRLHKQSKLNYVAYAQWPDKNSFDNSGNNLPQVEAKKYKTMMTSACDSINIINKFEVIEDLLKTTISD